MSGLIKTGFILAGAALVGALLAKEAVFWYGFANAGPRFTANDGQSLCLRVRALETKAGGDVLPCDYGDYGDRGNR